MEERVHESSRQRMTFDAYIRMGPERSLEALARILRDDPAAFGLGRPPARSTLERWSTTLHWQDRVADLERQARLKDAEAQVEALNEMNQRHRHEGLALQEKALKRIAAIPAEEMSASDAIRALSEGIRLERLGSGAPTAQVRTEGGQSGQIDLGSFSVEELRRLAELADRGAAGAREPEPQ